MMANLPQLMCWVGAPMGMAPMAHVVWSKFMNHSPLNSHWVGSPFLTLAIAFILLHIVKLSSCLWVGLYVYQCKGQS
jgi:phosphate/sulfate permease